MNPRIKPITVSPETTIRETLKKITGVAAQNLPTGIALVLDDRNRLLGVATDGDFRRAWAKGVDVDSPIRTIMIQDPITVPQGFSESEMIGTVMSKVRESGRIRDVKVDKVITVDSEGRVEDIVNFFELWSNLDPKNRTVCVVGLGFVGLTVAVALSDAGYKVTGFDINEATVKLINEGTAPFHEKGLSSLLKFHVSKQGFRATQSLEGVKADVYLISVGTPVGKGNQPNLELLNRSANDIGKVLKKKDLVILRSTVPVGTTRSQVIPLLEKVSGLKAGEDFFIAFAPERTVEGKALEELRSLPQVIGGINKKSVDVAANFFSSLSHTIVRVGSLESAEMVKLINNSFRDLSFAFANEFALLCDQWDLDSVRIIEAANEGYPRNQIPVPSPGVGGVCLRKDPYLYSASAREPVFESSLSQLGRRVNEHMPLHLFRKVQSFLEARKAPANAKVFLIGFAFKGEPETSDLRDSTTVDLLRIIQAKTAWKVHGFDPVINKSELENLGVAGVSLREGFKDADCVAILNNHRSYRDMDILGLADTMKKPGLILDTWHLFPREEIERVEGVMHGGLSGRD